MTAEIVQATPDAARRLTDRIKAGLELMWELVAEAYGTRAWAALGYSSWDDYCTREFGTARLQLPREERAQAVMSLRESGLSTRAIAAATGVDPKTVRNDLSTGESRPHNSPVGTLGNHQPRAGVGIDGKARVYPLRPRPPAPEPVFDDDPPPFNAPPPKPAPVMLTLRTHDGREVPYPKPQSAATFNQTDGDGISWAKWSWNPVTGCLHGCEYCYARSIAARWADAYPAGFTPLFHHERLDAPRNTAIPGAHRDDSHEACSDGTCDTCAWRRVFVCSMADLYGRWVPSEWIAEVHEAMMGSPRWQYILLTKFPDRYPGLEFPPGAWVGTSVDEQKRVRIAERAFGQLPRGVIKWLSLEPLREPLSFTDLSMFDWVVIGAQTQTMQPDGPVPGFQPEPRWVTRILHQAAEAGVSVHLKPNMTRFRAWLNQYPVSD